MRLQTHSFGRTQHCHHVVPSVKAVYDQCFKTGFAEAVGIQVQVKSLRIMLWQSRIGAERGPISQSGLAHGPISQEVDQQAKGTNKPVRSRIRTWQRSGVSPADSQVIGRAFGVKGKFLPVPSKALAMTSHASRWFLTERSKSQRGPIRYFRAHVMTTTLIPSQAMLWRRNLSPTWSNRAVHFVVIFFSKNSCLS